MAKRRRSPRRRTYKRRRSARRNPPVRLRGIQKQLTDGVVGAFQVTAGKATSRVLTQQLGIATEGATGIAVQAGVALLTGMVATRMFGATAGKMFLAGALTAPIESMVVAAGVPILSDALSAYPQLSSYPMSAYPGAIPSYPGSTQLEGYGETSDLQMLQQ